MSTLAWEDTPNPAPAVNPNAEAADATSSAPGAESTTEAVGDPATEEAKAGAAAGGASAADDAPKVRKIDSAPSEPVDLLDSAGAPVVKRAGPVVAVLIVLFFLGRRRSRKRKG